MLSTLAALVALQSLDSAADAARRRLAELPAAEQAIATNTAAAGAAVDAAKARLHDSQTARRALEKDVSAVDVRLARFDDHKAAVKTNHEYSALLHEIAMAKAEKDAIEERILLLMEEGDTLTQALKSEEAALAQARTDGDRARQALAAEQTALEAEVARLMAERSRESANVERTLLTKYEQLLKQRRGVAVAQLSGEICMACHVRLRPHVAQQVRRNDGIIQCDSCQRILYFVAPGPQASAGSAT